MTHPRLSILVAITALAVSACGTEVIFVDDGSGAGSNTGGNNTGASNTGASNTGGNTGAGNPAGGNTGGNNTGAGTPTGGSSGVDCVNAENGDQCGSPGSYCSYYDASTGESCDAWCTDYYQWEKNCYVEPTWCYQPPICPGAMPVNGTYCPNTDDCEYYDCEFSGQCGGQGYGYASCQDNVWYTYQDCYCYQPPDLCPATPPQDFSSCNTTAQCQQYDCEWQDACGTGTFHYAYCDGGLWYSNGDCSP